MSTIVVVRKNGYAAIAADTQLCQGSTLVPGDALVSPSKLHRVGDGFIGVVGSTAHHRVIGSLLRDKPDRFALQSADEIFETLREIHPVLQSKYYLLAKEEDSDDQPYESSQMSGLIASPGGVFSFCSHREVTEYRAFWAMGSGMEYALGALQVLYHRVDDPQEIAKFAVEAACQFDNGSGPPVESHSVSLADCNRSTGD